MLTEEEREILKLRADGLLNKEVACELGLTEAAVKSKMSSINRKLKTLNTPHAVAQAIRGHII